MPEQRFPLHYWWSITAGAMPRPTDPWESEAERTYTCRRCAMTWRDAAEGRRGLRSLRLHADCQRSLAFVSKFAAHTAVETRNGDTIVPAIRSLIAVKRAEVIS